MLKKAAALLLICASVGAWMIGCGTTSSRYLYAALPGGAGGGEIVAYREDPNAGVLTQLSGSPISAQGVEALVIHPSGKYLYAANTSTSSGPGNIALYTISASGALTEVSPRVPTGATPTLLVTDAAGSFLYVSNSASADISVYSIDSGSGKLTPVPQCSSSPTCTAPVGLQVLNMAVTPSGNTLYVTGQAQSGYWAGFPVSAGILGTPVASPPYTGTNPYGLAIDKTGTYLYTANRADNSISEFTINADGSLTSFVNSPVGESYSAPTALLIDKSGKYLYVANEGSGNTAAYSVGSNGGLTLLNDSPFATGAGSTVLATDSSGKFLFVGTQSGVIQSFTLDPSSGTLTSVASYSIGSNPTSIAITP